MHNTTGTAKGHNIPEELRETHNTIQERTARRPQQYRNSARLQQYRNCKHEGHNTPGELREKHTALYRNCMKKATTPQKLHKAGTQHSRGTARNTQHYTGTARKKTTTPQKLQKGHNTIQKLQLSSLKFIFLNVTRKRR